MTLEEILSLSFYQMGKNNEEEYSSVEIEAFERWRQLEILGRHLKADCTELL